MYKAVIIDDEPIIVEGLTKMIEWEKCGCTVVGYAYDGQDGLEIIRTKKPNIIISDIRMPRMDGLTMIAGIKSEFPDTQITILTGHREFDYAQRAISLGVNRFLLKPSKMDELQEAVAAMVSRLRDLKVPEGADQGIMGESEESYDSEASSFIVKNAVAYIEENYKEKLKLSDVAEHVYVSQWHLSKLLNRHAGQGFSEILNNVRIEKAKKLLKDPSLRIGDIADEVGFLDMSHFSRVFKKQVGISANEFRNTKIS